MTSLLAANPLAPAIELARRIPPEMVAAVIGALAGVALFVIVVGIVSSRRTRRSAVSVPMGVVLVPPYPVAPARITPASAFVPSSALSARVFAKMGYVVSDAVEAAAPEPVPCELEPLPPSSDIETGPMSAVTMAAAERTSSSVFAAAPIADLDLDDAPTELSEPSFDVAQPHL